MKKTTTLLVPLLMVMILATGCSQKNNNSKSANQNQAKENKQEEKAKSNPMANVCNFFPKELVEEAIGRPIVKTETPIIGADNCYYYTSYSETYDHTPYGDKPGGQHIVAVYDIKDFEKDKAYNETRGSKYESHSSIGMDNYVVKNNVNKIWLTALSLGNGVYLRFKSIDDAVTGEELVKIAQKFAEKIKNSR